MRPLALQVLPRRPVFGTCTGPQIHQLAHLAFAARFSDELAVVLIECGFAPILPPVDDKVGRRDDFLNLPSGG